MYQHTCPICGDPLYLTSCSVSCRIALSPDGFFLGDGRCDTDKERVHCENCDYYGTLLTIGNDK